MFFEMLHPWDLEIIHSKRRERRGRSRFENNGITTYASTHRAAPRNCPRDNSLTGFEFNQSGSEDVFPYSINIMHVF